MDSSERSEPSLAELLRMAADGELDAVGRAALEARADESDEARIAFERELRRAVGRTMGEPAAAPESLRARIEGLVAAENPAAQDRGEAGPIWSFAGRWMAVAAALLLVGAAVAMAVRTGAPSGPTFASSDAQVQLAGFMAREHDACADLGAKFQRKMSCRERKEAAAMLEEVVGAPAGVASLEGFRFVGIGPCGVPGGPSVHLLMECEQAGSRVSVFVVRDGGDGPTPGGGPCGVDKADLSQAAVVGLRRGELVYFVVSGDAGLRRRALASLERVG